MRVMLVSPWGTRAMNTSLSANGGLLFDMGCSAPVVAGRSVEALVPTR